MSFAHLLSDLAGAPEAAFWSDLYAVLNCTPHSTSEQIAAEYRAKLLTCHPDKLAGQAYDNTAFLQVRQAYVILNDPVERTKYDTWQQSGLALSYPRWRELTGSGQSLHWYTGRPQPRITTSAAHSDSHPGSSQPLPAPHEPGSPCLSGDDLYERFRRYEI
ncbi:DnaJ sub C member 12 [Dimargaris xerosporica]|nr:DnaJ sub C member 12 [Dimargaris xerosporica]